MSERRSLNEVVPVRFAHSAPLIRRDQRAASWDTGISMGIQGDHVIRMVWQRTGIDGPSWGVRIDENVALQLMNVPEVPAVRVNLAFVALGGIHGTNAEIACRAGRQHLFEVVDEMEEGGAMESAAKGTELGVGGNKAGEPVVCDHSAINKRSSHECEVQSEVSYAHGGEQAHLTAQFQCGLEARSNTRGRITTYTYLSIYAMHRQIFVSISMKGKLWQ